MKYIITGGEFNNKGAEAMTLITISRIREYDPNAEIALISNLKLPHSFKQLSIVRYSLCNNTIDYLLHDSFLALCKAWVKNFIKILRHKREKCVSPVHLKDFYKNAAYIIDVSGFALSSKFSRPRNQNFLDCLKIAQKHKVKTVLMPQSFGPFDFNYITKNELKNLLSFCHIIYAREQEGFQLLKELGLDNVIRSYDMVLAQKEIKYNLLFEKKRPTSFEFTPNKSKSYVGIIPNFRTIDNGNLSLDVLLELYSSIINFLLSQQKTVYLIPHAKEDISICKKIKEHFFSENDVITLNFVIHSYEYQEMISKFDFIIASRYHSIIHAYKECVPALILGWAVKYIDLAATFQQSHNVFNITDAFSFEDIIDALKSINIDFKKDSIIISNNLQNVQKNDYFKFLNCSQNISGIVQESLCTSCGICKAVCPNTSIEIISSNGSPVPYVNQLSCTNCGLCLRTCPATGMDFSNYNDPYIGDCYESYIVKTKDKEILKVSTSGGFVTTLIKSLLEQKIFDKAFLVDTDNYESFVHSAPIEKIEDSSSTPKSRYLQVLHDEAVKHILTHKDEKIIFVGTPCFFHGLTKVISNYHLNRNNYLLIGLFCDSTLNMNIWNYFSNHHLCKKTLARLHFRTKEAGGWPGNVRLIYQDSSYSDLPKNERMDVKKFFTPESCLYCLDKLNICADFSVGDNYTNINKDSEGSSNIIIRTNLAAEIWEKEKHNFEYRHVPLGEIITSQKIDKRKMNSAFIQLKNSPLINNHGIYYCSINPEITKEYKKKISYTKVGQTNDFSKIYRWQKFKTSIFYRLYTKLHGAK